MSPRPNPVAAVVLNDVAPSFAGYFACRTAGVDEATALAAAAAIALARVAWVACRERQLDGIAAFTGAVFAAGLGLSFVTGHARLLLAIKSGVTAGVSLFFVATCLAGRPAAFALAKRFGADEGSDPGRWDALYAAAPQFRRAYMVITLTWAAALLAEAVARIPVIYLLPTDAAAALSPTMLVATIVLLARWSMRYGERAEASFSRSAKGSPPPLRRRMLAANRKSKGAS